ncbi:uncharacterized protein LOC124155574 [Ischnura elegans]|uniref:uncharacterized protein LOC124155574 n=1 Tax=Ischnura elegans TaxID=197161 RepID=UPI001ED8BD3B|nr:uncharacterized protein LOC124155574 [Ischnura elegans]
MVVHGRASPWTSQSKIPAEMEERDTSPEADTAAAGLADEKDCRESRWQVPEHTVKAYDEWADRYELDVNSSNYSGAISACKAIADYYPLSKRNDVKILDVGAGTGMIGSYLKKNYFKNIDALDPSRKMLDKLREKKIYGTIWNDYIGFYQTHIPDGYYDCAVTSGAFTDDHIPVSSVCELVRIVKSGGVICTVIREENLTNSLEYCKLEPTFQDLEKGGKIEKVSRRVFSGYWFRSKGVCYMHKVL